MGNKFQLIWKNLMIFQLIKTTKNQSNLCIQDVYINQKLNNITTQFGWKCSLLPNILYLRSEIQLYQNRPDINCIKLIIFKSRLINMIIFYHLIFAFLIILTQSISSLDKNSGSSLLDDGQGLSLTPISTLSLQQQTLTFEQFRNSGNIAYISREEQTYRMLVFQSNLVKINQHNKIVKNGYATNSFVPVTAGYKMALNKFADLTERQFRQIYTKTYPTNNAVKQKTQIVVSAQINQACPCLNQNNSFSSFNSANRSQNNRIAQLDDQISNTIAFSQNLKLQSQELIPKNSSFSSQNSSFFSGKSSNNVIQDSLMKGKGRRLQQLQSAQVVEIDWTKHSGLIKFQGLCGACYAFATADALSAINSIFKFGFFVPLSIQQIVDCNFNGLTYGCGGGFLQGAYAFLQNSGITTEFAYKYKSKQQQCKIKNGTFKVASFKSIQQGSCSQLIAQLKNKPIAIGIAGYRLQFYSSGVFDDCNNYIDHAVLLIGYKTGTGWKIKNSWGTDWGMKGYAWIKDGNNCGICQNAVSATIVEQAIQTSI